MHRICGLNNTWHRNHEKCQAGLEIPVDLPMWPFVGHQDETKQGWPWRQGASDGPMGMVPRAQCLFSSTFKFHCKKALTHIYLSVYLTLSNYDTFWLQISIQSLQMTWVVSNLIRRIHHKVTYIQQMWLCIWIVWLILFQICCTPDMYRELKLCIACVTAHNGEWI